MNLSSNESSFASSSCELQATKDIYSALSCGGIIITFISLICNITSADPSLRAILVSLSVANIVSTGIFTYDILSVADMCRHLDDSSEFLVTASMALSLCHLMLLTLHFSIHQPAAVERKAVDNSALILTSWIFSATVGSMNINADNRLLKIILLVSFLLVLAFTLQRYIVTVKRRDKNEKIRKWYKETFLQRSLDISTRRKVVRIRGEWNRNVLRVVLYGYVGCSLPWMVNDLHETIEGRAHYLYRFIFLLVYLGNFYLISVVCICVGYAKCRGDGTKSDGARAFTKYRYTTTFSSIVV